MCVGVYRFISDESIKISYLYGKAAFSFSLAHIQSDPDEYVGEREG